jgi:hypothetical protein
VGVERWLLVLATAMAAGTAGAAADTIGSPAGVLKKGQWFMGAGGGRIADRKLDGGAEATAYQLGHVRGYGLTDWLSVYGKLGVAYLEIDDPSIKKRDDLSTTNRFGVNVLSGGELQVRLWQDRKALWEWDGSLQYTDIRKRHKGKNEIRWHQWGFGTSVARSFGRLRPYVGVNYSLIRAKYRVRQDGHLLQLATYKPDGVAGPFFGMDVRFGRGETVILNLETASADGAEATVVLSYTF